MCVIGHIPAKKTLPRQIFENCYDHNSHGWGIMYSLDGKINHIKSIGNFDAFWAEWRNVPREAERGVHFRIRTHGGTNQQNCHPFQPHEDILLMHNGVIDTNHVDNTMSDTWNFTEYVLKPVMKAYKNKGIDPLLNEGFVKILSELAGCSKLLLLDKEGKTLKINSGVWVAKDGCFFSNGHSLEKSTYSRSTTYHDTHSSSSSYYGDDYNKMYDEEGYARKRDNNYDWDYPSSKEDKNLKKVVDTLLNADGTPIFRETSSGQRYKNLKELTKLTSANVKSDLYSGNKTDEEGQAMVRENSLSDSFEETQRQIRQAMINDDISDLTEAEELEEIGVEAQYTVQHLLMLSPNDLSDWVQDYPQAATKILDTLLEQVVEAGLVEMPEREEESEVVKSAVNT